MSNHYHILISTNSCEKTSAFVQFLNCNITNHLNRINKHTKTI